MKASSHAASSSASRPPRSGIQLSDNAWLILIALIVFLLHLVTNHRYGFHRDELALLDDARKLALGYVAYPPLTPFLAHLELQLFGASLVGFRLIPAFVMSLVVFLAGWMARLLGGGRFAQLLSAVSVALAPMVLFSGAVFQYTALDFLWWVLLACFSLQLIRSENPRWWLAIGAVIGFGLMTKYTILILALGFAAGVLLTPARRYLRSPWLWAGVLLAVLMCIPNLVWQAQHDFISLEFTASIHARDVRIGRTDDFLLEQLVVGASPITLPIWIAGLFFYFRSPRGKPFRLLGWMYVIPLLLFVLTQGRSYYLAPAYPMLLAAGSVAWEGRLASLSPLHARRWKIAAWSLVAVFGGLFVPIILPFGAVNSPLWRAGEALDLEYREEIGWTDLTATVSELYHKLPPDERAVAGILTNNYGEAAALNLYGPDFGLPTAISGINSFWLRGYGDPPPQTLIVVGFQREEADYFFASCEPVERVTNSYGVINEESRDHPIIYLCRQPRFPWPELWEKIQSFG